MSDAFPIAEARSRLVALVRRTSHARERITITDDGLPAAVLISPRELADLEDAPALAQYRVRQNAGSAPAWVHDEVRSRLGLERG
ncbi:type II toxin-antitoxin system prevent-host-death family antitoxin [Streptomyces sp. NPDC005892]|uniref:type II toxin-antitoxin system prevent-host-death family antitoxin n=1 Tax=Streptomyces sp. NPDC005892 TaxID=3155593 RepID=UPI0033E201A2